MTRWCLIELLEATRKHIPIIIVDVQGSGFDSDEARRVANRLEEELESTNPSGLALLRDHIGQLDLQELKDACLGALDACAYNTIVFDQHATDLAMVATMKDGERAKFHPLFGRFHHSASSSVSHPRVSQ